MANEPEQTTEQPPAPDGETGQERLDAISRTLAEDPDIRIREPARYRRLNREMQEAARTVAEAEEAAHPSTFETEEEAEAALHRRQAEAARKREGSVDDFEREQRLSAAKEELARLKDLGFENVAEVEARLVEADDVEPLRVDLFRSQRELAEGRLNAATKTVAGMLEAAEAPDEMRQAFDRFVAGADDDDFAADVLESLMRLFDRGLKGEG